MLRKNLRWRAPLFYERHENTVYFRRFLNNGDNFHLRTALGAGHSLRSLLAHATGADHRIYLVNFREQTCPAFCASHKALGLRYRLRRIAGLKPFIVDLLERYSVNSWAPEVFFDPDEERWIIFWSSTIRGRFEDTLNAQEREGLAAGKPFNNRIYACTTKDFRSFSDTTLFYDPGFNVIDTTIERGEDGRFYLFIKHNFKLPEGPLGFIKWAVGDRASGPYGPMSEKISGEYMFCEGPNLVKIGSYWYCYFDLSAEHRMACVRAPSLSSTEWEDVTDRLIFPENVKHGCVLEISAEEKTLLLDI